MTILLNHSTMRNVMIMVTCRAILLPFEVGDTKSRLTRAAPVSCPSNVTLLGSPPKAAMFLLIHLKAAAMSLIPKLPPELSDLSKLGLVRRNPGNERI